MKNEKSFIINSLLDMDFYKFTMGLLVFKNYRDVKVRYAFKNRTKGVRISSMVKMEEIQEELDHIRTLRFFSEELCYLRGNKNNGKALFTEDYLDFLANLQLPAVEVGYDHDGEFLIDIFGKWSEAIYWETLILSVINELYYRAMFRKVPEIGKKAIFSNGRKVLQEKIELLKKHPGIFISEFGTRRRFSREWQYEVIQEISKGLGNQLIGTSNVRAAMDYGLKASGTVAHETWMGVSGLMHESDDSIRASHNKVLQDWWNEFGYGLSIALTDTYGTDFFFRDFTAEQAHNWKGLRQDSGDPFTFGEKAIAFYERLGIDPKEKVIIFSDGLDLQKIVALNEQFTGRIKIVFGWGTNLTNDLGFSPLSIVIKLMESNGHGTVKLSDNIAKAMGNPKDIRRFAKIFNYTCTAYEECKV